jgi:hypothetical protein
VSDKNIITQFLRGRDLASIWSSSFRGLYQSSFSEENARNWIGFYFIEIFIVIQVDDYLTACWDLEHWDIDRFNCSAEDILQPFTSLKSGWGRRLVNLSSSFRFNLFNGLEYCIFKSGLPHMAALTQSRVLCASIYNSNVFFSLRMAFSGSLLSLLFFQVHL